MEMFKSKYDCKFKFPILLLLQYESQRLDTVLLPFTLYVHVVACKGKYKQPLSIEGNVKIFR